MTSIAIEPTTLGSPNVMHQISSIVATNREPEVNVMCGYDGVLQIALMPRVGDSSLNLCLICWPEEFLDTWKKRLIATNRGYRGDY